jgi:hypothetical protein
MGTIEISMQHSRQMRQPKLSAIFHNPGGLAVGQCQDCVSGPWNEESL